MPEALPALAKARKLQGKAAKAGLLDRDALIQSQPALSTILDDAPTEEGVGKLLWQIVALAHQHDIDAEDALRAYAVQFRQRADGTP